MENKFLTGKVKEVVGFNNRPHCSDNRTVIQFVSTDGEYESIENNDKISKIWVKAKEEYRGWWRNQAGFKLGEIKTIQVQSDTEIISAVAFDPKLNLEAVKSCLDKIGKQCQVSKNNIHINKFGNKKQWKQIQDCIDTNLVAKGLTVYIYLGE